MKIVKWFVILLPVAGCALMLWICIVTLSPIEYPYPQDQEISMFDASNNKTLSEFPPPNGVMEMDRSSSGIVNDELGRVLAIDYKIINYTSSSAVEIKHYYLDLFTSKGWIPLFGAQDEYSGTFGYIKGSGCIRLNVHPSPPDDTNLDQYSLEIWHDFYSQSFSPHKPNLQLFEQLNFDQLTILCPPS